MPADRRSLAEILVVIRVRWQIALLFKLWKSHSKIATWRTTNPHRILCDVYAKVSAMVVQHWCMLTQCWAFPDRSLVKAARVVRAHAVELAGAQGCVARLTAILTTIQRVLARTAHCQAAKTAKYRSASACPHHQRATSLIRMGVGDLTPCPLSLA